VPDFSTPITIQWQLPQAKSAGYCRNIRMRFNTQRTLSLDYSTQCKYYRRVLPYSHYTTASYMAHRTMNVPWIMAPILVRHDAWRAKMDAILETLCIKNTWICYHYSFVRSCFFFCLFLSLPADSLTHVASTEATWANDECHADTAVLAPVECQSDLQHNSLIANLFKCDFFVQLCSDWLPVLFRVLHTVVTNGHV